MDDSKKFGRTYTDRKVKKSIENRKYREKKIWEKKETGPIEPYAHGKCFKTRQMIIIRGHFLIEFD
tara:strand:+ start:699 stop:896 length:198 start_codon:yes stop_codon:yes gene_type:complete